MSLRIKEYFCMVERYLLGNVINRPSLRQRSSVRELEHTTLGSKYLEMIEDCESYRLYVPHQWIGKGSQHCFVLIAQTLALAQAFLQYEDEVRP